MQKSNFPDEGIAGGLYATRFACSQREIQSPVDPASFESYVELMRQGAAASARVAAAARILQREAHRTSLTAKAAMGALYKAGEDPFRLLNIQFTAPYKGKVGSEGKMMEYSRKRMRRFQRIKDDGTEEYDEDYDNAEEEMPDPKEEAKKQARKKADLLKRMKETARKHKKKAIIGAAVAGSIAAVSAIEKKSRGKDQFDKPKTPGNEEEESKRSGYGVNGGRGGDNGGYGVNGGAPGSSNQRGQGNSNRGGVPSNKNDNNGNQNGNNGNQNGNNGNKGGGWMNDMRARSQGIFIDEGFAAAGVALMAARDTISHHAAASFMASRESAVSWHQRKTWNPESLKSFL